MAKKVQYWDKDEFVDWDELMFWVPISGKQRDDNWQRCEALKIPEENRCPICEKEVKSQYRTIRFNTDTGITRFGFNPEFKGKDAKVGLTCFRNLCKAKIEKYGH